jgi:hypothetical protein
MLKGYKNKQIKSCSLIRGLEKSLVLYLFGLDICQAYFMMFGGVIENELEKTF